jgi:hypothetical protein
MALAAATPGWLLPTLLLVQAVVFIYLASVGRYGSSSLSRYLIMLIWAVIPILWPVLVYYVGKGLVTYAALDRSGVIRAARIPSVKWQEALSALVPVLLILALAAAGIGLLRYTGVETPANRWEAWTDWISDGWSQVGSNSLTEQVRDGYASARDWVTGLSFWPR